MALMMHRFHCKRPRDCSARESRNPPEDGDAGHAYRTHTGKWLTVMQPVCLIQLCVAQFGAMDSLEHTEGWWLLRGSWGGRKFNTTVDLAAGRASGSNGSLGHLTLLAGVAPVHGHGQRLVLEPARTACTHGQHLPAQWHARHAGQQSTASCTVLGLSSPPGSEHHQANPRKDSHNGYAHKHDASHTASPA